MQPSSPDASSLPSVADRLHSVAIHLLRRVRRADPATGVPPAQLSALSVVVFAGPITLGALAAAEQVRPPTMSRLVNALEQRGLIQRKRSTTDRRAVTIRATDEGLRVLTEGRNRRVSLLTEQLQSLSPDDLSTLKHTVSILETLFQKGVKREA